MIDKTKIATNKHFLEDKKISITIMSSFAILTIQYFVLIYFNLIGTNLGQVVQLTSKGIVGFFYFLALPAVIKRRKTTFIVTYLIWIFLFIINYVIFSQNWIYLKSIIFPLFFICLPSFIYAYSIHDINVLIEVINKTYNVIFIFGALIGILVFVNKASIGDYSMSLSYYMLLPSIIGLYNFFKQNHLRSLLLSLISFFVILSLGARGPVMCLGFFIINYIIKNNLKINYKNLFLMFLAIMIFIFLLLNFENIIFKLYNYFTRFGIQSRTLLLLLEGRISQSSSRNNLYNEIWYLIKDNPIFGIGLAGDRYYTGMYVHNIFLEILSGFGIIVGSFLVLLLLIICYKVFRMKNLNNSNLLIIWMSIGLIPLLVSGSYLTHYQFWIFLGIFLKLYRFPNVKD